MAAAKFATSTRSATTLLIVATDRISAFDYVLRSGIPDKGKVLTQLSAFWFERMGDLVPHHVIATDVAALPRRAPAVRGRAARALDALPAHAAGADRVRRARLPRRAPAGRNTSRPAGLRHRPARRVARIRSAARTDLHPGDQGRERARREHQRSARPAASSAAELVARLKALTLEIYRRGVAHAETKGIIIADTKFEFGLVGDGHPATDVVLIDEVLTPDSSRFWPQDQYQPGGAVPSFDKQFVRDYLEEISWNKQPPVPTLPDEVIERTRGKYVEAFRRLSGRELV